MSSSTPRETSGALPEWSGIQKTDKNMIIDPILQQYRAVMRAALQEHMNLVTSQYMTGYARASRESGIGAAMPKGKLTFSNHGCIKREATFRLRPRSRGLWRQKEAVNPVPTIIWELSRTFLVENY